MTCSFLTNQMSLSYYEDQNYFLLYIYIYIYICACVCVCVCVFVCVMSNNSSLRLVWFSKYLLTALLYNRRNVIFLG